MELESPTILNSRDSLHVLQWLMKRTAMYISVVSIRLYMPVKSIFKPTVGKILAEIRTTGTLEYLAHQPGYLMQKVAC